MPDSLHDALTRTLTVAADHAPAASSDLFTVVDRRYRRRRRHTYAVVAGATVLTLAGGYATVAADLLPTDGSNRRDPGAAVSRGPAGGAARTVDRVWPQAVRDVPTTLPDGRPYRPETLVDGTTLLVTAPPADASDADLSLYSELWLYDMGARTARLLARTTGARETGATHLAHLVTGDGHVAWWTLDPSTTPGTVRIWAVPLTGGTPVAVTTLPSVAGQPAEPDRLAVVDGTVAWSLSGTGGVYQAPLTGGPVRAVAGTAGHHLVTWPWVGTPGEQFGDRGEAGGRTVYRELRNVRTGERRTAPAAGAGELWQCGPTRCIGRTDTGRTTEARDRDGGRRRKLPGAAVSASDSNSPGLALDRFVLVMAGEGKNGSTVLHDLATGRTADLGVSIGGADGGFPTLRGPAERLLHHRIDGGRRYRLVDLAAIG